MLQTFCVRLSVCRPDRWSGVESICWKQVFGNATIRLSVVCLSLRICLSISAFLFVSACDWQVQ